MTARILSKLFSRMVSADFMGLILLLTALQAFTYGISSSLRGADASQSIYFFWVCLLAMLVTLALSKLKLNGIYASVGMVALGIAGVWILGARLADPLLALGNVLLAVVPQIVPAIRADLPIDTAPIREAWLVVAQASAALSARVQVWLMGMSGNVTVNDALVRNMVWTLIMWLLAAWIGWFAGRRNAAAALLPSIALLAAVTSYSEYRIYTLWLLVSVLLLLMGIWNYKEHTVQWRIRKVDYSDSIRYDVGQAVIFLTIIIGAITFVTPSVSWQQIRDYLRERNQSSENEAADLLGIQQQRVAGKNPVVQKPSMPRDHLLTGGNALSEEVVMIIRTGELPPVVNPSIAAEAPRYYWRSISYDTYVGSGWVTSSPVPQRLQPNTPLIPGLLSGYRSLHLDVEMIQPEGRLFWSGILFSTDASIRADWRLRPQSELFADQATLLQADMFAAASSARSYRAESYLPRVTVEELRRASSAYPDIIHERYLELPNSVPERVLQLAQELTRDQTNAYDKAKAIEAYLRTYPYDLEVPAPPEDQDVADYFLFELKKGYCDYYATAMVVLARASGIPARFVSGYSSGSYDAANAQYIVRELNAHSWVEVFFPEIGWVEFEPTASQPEVELALAKVDVPAVETPESAASRLLYRFRLERAIYWLSPLLIIFFVLLAYFTWIERWWYLRLAPATAITRMYQRLYRLGRSFAGEPTRAETAQEFRQKLVEGIDQAKERSRFTKLYFGAQQDVELLTDMYQDALFSRGTVKKAEARKALNTWKRLRRRLLVARAGLLLKKRFNVPTAS